MENNKFWRGMGVLFVVLVLAGLGLLAYGALGVTGLWAPSGADLRTGH